MIVCLLLLYGTVQCREMLVCGVGKSRAFDSKKNSVACVDCAANCQKCRVADDSLESTCSLCFDGYYLNDLGACIKCDDWCESCVGGGYDKCTRLVEGRFYNSNLKQVYECGYGCSLCDLSGNCIVCKSDHVPFLVVDDKKNKKIVDGRKAYSCLTCVENYCDLYLADRKGADICSHCNKGYGINLLTRHCEKCRDECASCQENSLWCDTCIAGFEWSPIMLQCEKISTEHCYSVDYETGLCSVCEDGFTFDNEKRKCESCGTTDGFCSQCSFIIEEDKEGSSGSKEIRCDMCVHGFVWSREQRKCLRCSKNCEVCTTQSECSLCVEGFYLKGGQCVPLDIKSCDVMSESEGCLKCTDGSYRIKDNNGKFKCEKCDTSCISCVSPSATSCTTCGVTKFELFSGLDRINKMKSCPVSCPEEDSNVEKKYLIDNFNRQCRIIDRLKEVESLIPTTKYRFKRTADRQISPLSLSLDSISFAAYHKYYTSESIRLSIEYASMGDKTTLYSRQCAYRGKVVHRINFDRESRLECLCLDGYRGQMCGVDPELLESTRMFLSRMLADVRSILPSLKPVELYKVVTNLNVGIMNADTLLEMTGVIVDYHSFLNNKTKSPVLFLIAIDSMIRSHYNFVKDMDRGISNRKADVEDKLIEERMRRSILRLVALSEKVFVNSIRNTGWLPFLNTISFQKAYCLPRYNKVNKGTFKNPEVFSSDIDETGILHKSIEFKFLPATLINEYKVYDIIASSYSNQLFYNSSRIEIIMTSVFTISVREKATGLPPVNQDVKLYIRFPLRIMPAETDFKDKLKCQTMKYDEDKNSFEYEEGPIHTAVNQADKEFNVEDEENKINNIYVYCSFKKFQLSQANNYYAVVYRGTTKKRRPDITIKSMDEDDSYLISNEEYVHPSDYRNSGISKHQPLLNWIFLSILVSILMII